MAKTDILRIKKALKGFVDLATNPIVNNFGTFLSLIILQALGGIIYSIFFSAYNKFANSLGILIYSFIISYFTLLISKYLNRLYGRIFYYVILSVICIHQFINIFCIFTLHTSYSKEFGNVVAGTNFDEAREFCAAHINAKSILCIALCIITFIVLAYIFRWVAAKFKNVIQAGATRTLLLVALVACIPVAILRSGSSIAFSQSILGIYSAVESYERVVSIEPTNPKLSIDDESNVQNIVIVIGESFSKFHSNLYGYNKETNPCLSAMPDSLLHTFKNVESTGTHTIEAFSSFMTTSEKGDIPNCYKCPNIIELAKISGYNTMWISNQSKAGTCDNKIAIFAQLCDSAIWNGDKLSGLAKKEFDGELIPYINDIKLDGAKRLIVVHLMGSHDLFEKRYPGNFGKFTPNDYADSPNNQKSVLAHYDNSILYNDYVLSRIIERFASEDAVLLYFSDHALDVFNTDSEYCGHARPDNEESGYYGRQIPFFMYTSGEFRKNHSDLTQKIDESTDKQLNTTDLPYMIMQLMGVTFTDRSNKYPFAK